MKALVVFESMYGNTHAVAEAIGTGLGRSATVTVVPVTAATPELVADADLVVVGGPTHIHGMTSQRSRTVAVTSAPKSGLAVDPDAPGTGLRGWLDGLVGVQDRPAAAFDTRIAGSPMLTGRASPGIARRLRRRGYRVASPPESFLVDKSTHLLPGEIARAEEFGAALASVTIEPRTSTMPG